MFKKYFLSPQQWREQEQKNFRKRFNQGMSKKLFLLNKQIYTTYISLDEDFDKFD